MSRLGDQPRTVERRDGRAPRRHVWRETVVEAWSCAMHVWELDAEAASVGYATELAEWEETHPRPRLRDFMIHLAYGGSEKVA